MQFTTENDKVCCTKLYFEAHASNECNYGYNIVNYSKNELDDYFMSTPKVFVHCSVNLKFMLVEQIFHKYGFCIMYR